MFYKLHYKTLKHIIGCSVAMAITCWAPDCNHNNVREQCTFYRFPKNMKVYRKWLGLLRRDAEPGSGARICSCHFKDKKKENLPEIFVYNKEKRFEEHYLSPEKKRAKRNISKMIISTSEEPQAGPSTEDFHTDSTTKDPQPGPSTSSEVDIQDFGEHKEQYATRIMLEAENSLLHIELERKDKIINSLKIHMTYHSICENDKLILEYTGIPTRQIFESLYAYIENVEIQYYLKWKVQKLEKIDQLLLVLMKLRHNFTHIDLAFRFQVSEATITNVVTTYIHVLYEALYENLMGKVPTRLKNKSCLPNCCSNFTNCRIIIDCTDISCHVPRQSMKKQRLTYSNYKHRNTLKGLVGVAPNGVITFISHLYPGSTSDKNIVKHCGLLNHLEAGDLVLADKGFLIKDLLPAGVSLNVPPFLSTPQFTVEQVNQTKCIARARIHVERAIRRMKSYRILNMIPEQLFPYASKIFRTVGALTNLQFPLIREVSQFYVGYQKITEM